MPRTESVSEVSGRIAGAGIGMGYGWWQDKHTRHHANPDNEGLDPDVAPRPAGLVQRSSMSTNSPSVTGPARVRAPHAPETAVHQDAATPEEVADAWADYDHGTQTVEGELRQGQP